MQKATAITSYFLHYQDGNGKEFCQILSLFAMTDGDSKNCKECLNGIAQTYMSNRVKFQSFIGLI